MVPDSTVLRHGARVPRLHFVSHTFPPADQPLQSVGGMQRVATELYGQLVHHPDLEVTARVLRTPWRWIGLRTPFFLLRAAAELERRTRQGQVDTVLFSSVLSAALVLPMVKSLRTGRVKTVAIAHGLDVMAPLPLYQRFVRRALCRLDAVVPVSRATAVACQERGVLADRVHVIPNGIDLQRFCGAPDRATARCELAGRCGRPLPADAFLLCSVGRHVPRKGFLWFVQQVMPRLPDTVHYWLAGCGPESAAIAAAAAAPRLRGRVHLLGRVSEGDLGRLYRAAELFVMPNVLVPGTMEGFGVVVLEAGLCGLPTIAADLEGLRDAIAEGHNGHLVPPGHPGAFVRAICRYEGNRARLAAMAHRARQHCQGFGWGAIAQRHVGLLASLQGQPAAALQHTRPGRTAVPARMATAGTAAAPAR